MQNSNPLFVVLAVNLLSVSPALAQKFDQSIARQCTAHLLRLEKQHQVPKALLFAIAQTESGHKISNVKQSMPWPWTINVQGKPFYFQTKEQAIAEASRLLKMGIRNIDIGCMQINYHYHGHHFPSLVHMFDPQQNVEYGAGFLKALKREHGSWTKAVGLYHSATPELQLPYKRKVYVKWQQEQKRLYQEEFIAAQSSLLHQRLHTLIPFPRSNSQNLPPLVLTAHSPSTPQFFKKVVP
jgi:transglycosylase-like protein with SLT domain